MSDAQAELVPGPSSPPTGVWSVLGSRDPEKGPTQSLKAAMGPRIPGSCVPALEGGQEGIDSGECGLQWVWAPVGISLGPTDSLPCRGKKLEEDQSIAL